MCDSILGKPNVEDGRTVKPEPPVPSTVERGKENFQLPKIVILPTEARTMIKLGFYLDFMRAGWSATVHGAWGHWRFHTRFITMLKPGCAADAELFPCVALYLSSHRLVTVNHLYQLCIPWFSRQLYYIEIASVGLSKYRRIFGYRAYLRGA